MLRRSSYIKAPGACRARYCAVCMTRPKPTTPDTWSEWLNGCYASREIANSMCRAKMQPPLAINPPPPMRLSAHGSPSSRTSLQAFAALQGRPSAYLSLLSRCGGRSSRLCSLDVLSLGADGLGVVGVGGLVGALHDAQFLDGDTHFGGEALLFLPLPRQLGFPAHRLEVPLGAVALVVAVHVAAGPVALLEHHTSCGLLAGLGLFLGRLLVQTLLLPFCESFHSDRGECAGELVALGFEEIFECECVAGVVECESLFGLPLFAGLDNEAVRCQWCDWVEW